MWNTDTIVRSRRSPHQRRIEQNEQSLLLIPSSILDKPKISSYSLTVFPCYMPGQYCFLLMRWLVMPCYAVKLILLISWLFLVTRRCNRPFACYAPSLILLVRVPCNAPRQSSVRDAVCTSGEIAVPCYAESQILLISCQFLVVRRCNRMFACYAPRLVLLISYL